MYYMLTLIMLYPHLFGIISPFYNELICKFTFNLIALRGSVYNLFTCIIMKRRVGYYVLNYVIVYNHV